MAAQRNQPFVTPEEYLAIERAAEYKSEYYSGEMVAMSGTTLRHGAIAANLTIALGNALKGKPCRPYGSDIRVRVRSTNYVYPDVSVVCGKPELLHDAYLDTVLNPKAIFEVLSKTTESNDRGIKWRLYQQIDSLEHYVLLDQDMAIAEVYTRQPNNDWLVHSESGMTGTLSLPAIDTTLALSDLYESVEIETNEPSSVP